MNTLRDRVLAGFLTLIFSIVLPGGAARSVTATFIISSASSTATLRFDSATGPTTKTIVRNSGTPVTFAWKTANLPSGTTCKIVRRPDDSYGKSASPVAGGTVTDTGIHTWAVGIKTLYLRCSNGTISPDITLTISGGTPSATLRFDSATGPTTKTIVQNSGTPVTFAWKTTSLPSGATCKILRRPNDDYSAAASPASGGTRTDPNISTWSVGAKKFYLRCSNGTTSPDITLTITAPAPTATLRFDSATGPTTKTIVRNSGTPVTFAWKTTSLPSGATCKILRRPNDDYSAAASPASGGTRTDPNISTWSVGVKVLYLRCSNGTTSPDIMLTISSPGYVLSVQKSGTGSGTVSSSPAGINCGSTCSASFAINATITLTATADGGNSVFTGWSGACSGIGSTCTLSMNAAKTVNATFSYLGTGVAAIAAGNAHTCALTQGGAVKCWGFNSNGQLGDGSTTDRPTPVNVSGLGSGVRAIAAGGGHTCALTQGGAVVCWGYNLFGQLGDGSLTTRLTPVNVSGLGSGVQAIAAGSAHTCALTQGGAVKCWGWNGSGQLGDGSTSDRAIPVNVSGLGSGVQAIATGITHTCALTQGTLKCWGYNGNGQLGDGSTTSRATPVNVSGLGSGVQAMAAGNVHTCALTQSGAVKCWGANGNGQLGDGSTTARLTPVNVSGLGSAVQAIALGNAHTCALTQSGALKCWGYNGNGQLGDGSVITRLTPVNVSSLDSGVQEVTAGSSHTCALTQGGSVKCWGFNGNGQLGDGSTTERHTPVNVSGLGSGAQAIAAGYAHTCAVTQGGSVKCWGWNVGGQLGDGSATDRSTPVNVSGLGNGIQAVAAGEHHTCALTQGGVVKCWGFNYKGQLGDGDTIDRFTPVNVSGLGGGAQAIAAGAYHTCALTRSGAVKCWGWNDDGELGDGSTMDRYMPVNVSGLDSGVRAISAGYSHTCALTQSGAVKCWGLNEDGQLGDGSTIDRFTPVSVSGLGSGVQAIAAGSSHTCALTESGVVKCWGYNVYGQLGDGSTTSRAIPVNVSGLDSGVQAITAGVRHTCVLTQGGAVMCWGNNLHGQLGDGSMTSHVTPVNVSGFGSGIQVIASGGVHTCALTQSGAVKCWGYNGNGQLGDGSTTTRLMPVNVSGFGD